MKLTKEQIEDIKELKQRVNLQTEILLIAQKNNVNLTNKDIKKIIKDINSLKYNINFKNYSTILKEIISGGKSEI